MSARSETPTEVVDRDLNPISYLEGYVDSNADVVLVGSDRVGLRVHDYYLKAASVFFLDMLNAGTKGGPVPLDATSLQLRFIMDRVTGRVPRYDTLKALAKTAPGPVIADGWHAIWSLIKLDDIAKRYLMTDASAYIHQLISCYADQNPPAVLLHSCQCSPIDGRMAMAALKAFKDEMAIWMDQYFESSTCIVTDNRLQHYFSPEPANLRKDFAMTLCFDAFFAYTRALNAGSVIAKTGADDGYLKHMGHDWDVVADSFMKTMEIPQYNRSWLLQHDDDEVASVWSVGSPAGIVAPRTPPSSSSQLGAE